MPQSAKQPPQRIRTCIACGAKQGKTQLVRIVRTDGGPVLDASGRMAGRGAYVCGPDCLDRAIRKRALDRALKTKVDEGAYARLASEMSEATANALEGKV